MQSPDERSRLEVDERVPFIGSPCSSVTLKLADEEHLQSLVVVDQLGSI
jgi:hypothetical protein